VSVQPIDLQVLFARLNQISRDQAIQRDFAVQSQAVTADEIVEKSDARDHAVTETNTEEEGPEGLGDKQEGGQQQEKEGRGAGREDEEKAAFFSDPDLGQNVDISG
jgi:hypothetical protein